VQPSSQPSKQPSSQPSRQPSIPTGQPTTRPTITVAPSFKATRQPTASGTIPTASPTSIALFEASQGIALDSVPATAVQKANFEKFFGKSVESTLNLPDFSVNVSNAVYPARRLNNVKRSLDIVRLLAAGTVQVEYSVKVFSSGNTAAASVLTALTADATVTALNSNLISFGYTGASATTPVVVDRSPTSAPAFASSGFSLKKCSTVLALISSFSLFLLLGLY